MGCLLDYDDESQRKWKKNLIEIIGLEFQV